MKNTRAVFVCQECGAQAPKWMGRCNDCGAWNSLVEERPAGPGAPIAANRYAQFSATGSAKAYADVDLADALRISTGIGEFDRVLGGGVVPGSLVLLGGDPGIGKSTLLLQAAAHFARAAGPVLYASGEESEHQIKSRGDRLEARNALNFGHDNGGEFRRQAITNVVQEPGRRLGVHAYQHLTPGVDERCSVRPCVIASLGLGMYRRCILTVDHHSVSTAPGQLGQKIRTNGRREEQRPKPPQSSNRLAHVSITIDRFATSSSITSVAPPPIGRMRASRDMRSIAVSRM